MSRPGIIHGGEHLTPQQRREFVRLSQKVDVVLEGDRRFFDRHPDRSYRLRRAAEVELGAARMAGTAVGWEPGYAWFVVVRQFAPGVRSRAFFSGPENNDTDVTEAEAQWLYRREVAAQPIARSVDKQMEAIGAGIAAGGAK